MSIMVCVMNLILKFNPSAQTAYGLFYKVQQFVLFLAFGLRDAITDYCIRIWNEKQEENSGRNQIWSDFYRCINDFRNCNHRDFSGSICNLFNAGQSREYFISAMRVISLLSVCRN